MTSSALSISEENNIKNI